MQITRLNKLLYIIPMLCIALAGCGSKSKTQDMKEYVEQVKKQNANTKPPTFKVKNIPKQIYQYANSRSPFSSASRKARKHYPNTILTEHLIQSLKLLGTLAEGNKIWAIVATPNGRQYKITVGSRVGNSHALVTQITQNQVKFEEENTGGKPTVTILRMQTPPPSSPPAGSNKNGQ